MTKVFVTCENPPGSFLSELLSGVPRVGDYFGWIRNDPQSTVWRGRVASVTWFGSGQPPEVILEEVEQVK